MSKMWVEKMNLSIVNLYLFWGSIRDIKKKKITNYYLWLGAFIGLIFRILECQKGISTYVEWCAALVPGAVIWVLAKITREKIGEGDGWVVIVLGNFMNFFDITILLHLAVILSASFSLILLFWKKVPVRYSIPFLPFLWLSHFLLWRFYYV